MPNLSPQQEDKIQEIADLVIEMTMIDTSVLSDLIVTTFADIPLPPNAYELVISRIRSMQRAEKLAHK